MTRWVLVWFALSLGVAVASPMVSPQSAHMVCSQTGTMKLVSLADDGSTGSTGFVLDCPLCANLGAPPPMLLADIALPVGLASSGVTLAIPHITTAAHGRWQARAPPLFL
jgi:hypothetical protein